MIDHIGLPVSDLARSKAFYSEALEPLGVAVLMEVTAEQSGTGDFVGYGADVKAFFWLDGGKSAASGVHIAFTASARAQVDAFHAAAMAAGGRDNGSPGPRPHYGEHYYGAFVLDPDGNNVEAVCRTPG